MSKIVLEDFSEGDGYYKVDLAYLSKEQVEEIETLVSKWKPTDEDIKACIGMCLTDVNEQRFKDYGTNLRDCLAWLEKQAPKPQGKTALEAIHEKKVDNANKVELRFHEGDWLCENKPNNYARFIQILETVNVQGKERYRVSRDIHNDEDTIEFDFVEKYYHKFDIKDARDGDILVDVYGNIGIYEKCNAFYWVSYRSLGHDGDFRDFKIEHENEKTYPATKEQQDLLFQKMKENNWEWDAKKKELNKIEQKLAWSEEDEEMFNSALDMIYWYSGKNKNKVISVGEWLQLLKQKINEQ